MDFSTIKHEMAVVFEQITARTDEGLLPDEIAVNKFYRLCQRMHQIADDVWIGEAEDFSHLSHQLLNAVKKNDVESSVMLVESLQDAQAYCHRTFRE
ncbi:GAK system XXXCH domain-containing protein [Desulfolutivibrio sp.]|uniref:GAK system XXXCH domain-containing protein n=1 Tax=Desulfolutivibrio sp. TaxID=2773296 RepID=UPI002F96DF47